MDNLNDVFNQSLQTGFVNKSIISDAVYQPELLVNQIQPPKKILSILLQEFEKCSEFYITVAFVTTSGVATIINKIKELENRGINGKILVSQYLNFTEPEALKRLLQFKNIDLRIATTGNAHSKGYIFKHKNHYNLIVGSSNLTANAITTNKEWNIKVSALSHSGLVEKVLNEFNADFENATIVSKEYINSYEKLYQQQFLLSANNQENDQQLISGFAVPNRMQSEALQNLQNLRAGNKNKSLIISATGTGKTYLSAFDAKAFNPSKLLFVVHRLTIAKSALKTFKKVFGNGKSMGLYSGNQLESDCDFIFSTIQTISKPEHLQQFEKEHFDYIIIDETHRSAANSYSRLIEYFKPQFLLGMTATPERADGENIFEIFDYNIAYEIRLNKAMEEDMLSPFHYYGVTDLIVNNKVVDNKTDFNHLVSSERAERIIEQSKFYGSDNGIIRGLIFCSRNDEALELSRLLNLKGYKTVALNGASSEQERSNAIELLETDDLSKKIDYILTVDIFNEGIDIPRINQIIMLRPTESAVIFIQQLGRGLRKADGKHYLTLIDFIGNYDKNYLIPIALYGDTSYNKDSLRKLLTDGSRMLPGSSTINFDEITKERIFQSIDVANMQLFADLKNDYNLLKFKTGKIPMMMDFIEHGSRDPFLYVEHSKSYFNFVNRVENYKTISLSNKEIKLLELFSKEINNSKRVEESIILKELIDQGQLSINTFKEQINSEFNYIVSNQTIQSCIRNLNFEFIRENKNNKLVPVKEIIGHDIIAINGNNFEFSETFKSLLDHSDFKKYLLDSVNYSIYQFKDHFIPENWSNGFILYKKYSRKDVFRILNVNENPVAQNVGGYLVSPDNSHCPIFVNYHKEEHISESTKYEDEFLNTKEFVWMSKSNRRISSSDVQSILGKKGPVRLPLFIKKNNDEGTEFYYMGELTPNHAYVEETTMNNNSGGQVPVVKIRFNISPLVSDSIYNYLNDTGVLHRDITKHTNKNEMPLESKRIETPKTIRLYNFYAAAGTFSEIQSDIQYTEIEAPNKNIETKNYFACKIVGESMNRVIPNGSICLFKLYSGGSREGKILLIENHDFQDEDFNSAFTIKTYSSEKIVTSEGWQHKKISLRPNSYDNSYKEIIITEENAKNMKIIGEFISIIS
jgi:superfamily II DNA or RNA helicase/phage repressor protein C with HTH and peptisase S24 domain